MILNCKLQTLTTIEGQETGPAERSQCPTDKKKTFSPKEEKLHTLKTSNGQKTLPLHACTRHDHVPQLSLCEKSTTTK